MEERKHADGGRWRRFRPERKERKKNVNDLEFGRVLICMKRSSMLLNAK